MLPFGGGPLSSSVTAASSMTLLKCIKETPPGDHPTTDIWLLACSASAPHNRSKVLSLVKSKAIAGEFTSRMMRYQDVRFWLRSSNRNACCRPTV